MCSKSPSRSHRQDVGFQVFSWDKIRAGCVLQINVDLWQCTFPLRCKDDNTPPPQIINLISSLKLSRAVGRSHTTGGASRGHRTASSA